MLNMIQKNIVLLIRCKECIYVWIYYIVVDMENILYMHIFGKKIIVEKYKKNIINIWNLVDMYCSYMWW